MASETIREFLVSVGFKSDENSLKRTLDGIEDLTKSVLKLGAIIEATALTVAVGVAKFASNLEELYFTSARTGATATNIKALDRAARDFGAGAGEAQASLEGLARFLRTNPGGEQTIANWFGIKTRDKSGKALGPDELLLAMAKSMQGMPAWQALQRGEAAGLSENVILAMMNPKFGANFDTISNRLKAAGFEEAAIHAHAFMEELRTLGDALVVLGTRVEDALQQKLGISLKSITDWLEHNQGWIISTVVKVVGAFIDQFNIVVAWLTAHGPEIKKMIKEAIEQFDKSWKIIKPALEWVYGKLVELDAATDGWSTKLLVLGAILGRTGALSVITGVLGLAAAFGKLGVSILAAGGGAAGGALARLGAGIATVASIPAVAFTGAAAAGVGLGYGFDKLFPKIADWLGEHVGGLLFDTVQFANQSMQASKPETWTMGALMRMGWSKEHAAGIVANLQAESSLNEKAVNGTHYGLAQWDASRQADFAKWAGFDIHNASFGKQLEFLNYELTQGKETGAGGLLLASKNADQAGQIMSHYYERPGLPVQDALRGAHAAALSQQTNIYVQGSDPRTIAKHVASEQDRVNQAASARLIREASVAMR